MRLKFIIVSFICFFTFSTWAQENKDQYLKRAMKAPAGMGPSPLPTIQFSGLSNRANDSQDMTHSNLLFSSPLFMSKEKKLIGSLSGSQIHFNQDQYLSSGTKVPTDLNKAEVSFQYSEQLEQGKNWSLRTTYGSASDSLFSNYKDNTFSLMGSYGFPGEDKSFWVVSAYLSNNSTFLNYFPIPGVMYMIRGQKLNGVIGFPVTSLTWKLDDRWDYSAALLGPQLSTEFIYNETDTTQFYSGFSWVIHSYLRSNRTEADDRFVYEEKKFFLGMRSNLTEKILADVQLGRAYDRTVYEGKGFRNKDRGSFELPSSFYLSCNLKFFLF